jgi:hypothetical protein
MWVWSKQSWFKSRFVHNFSFLVFKCGGTMTVKTVEIDALYSRDYSQS